MWTLLLVGIVAWVAFLAGVLVGSFIAIAGDRMNDRDRADRHDVR